MKILIIGSGGRARHRQKNVGEFACNGYFLC